MGERARLSATVPPARGAFRVPGLHNAYYRRVSALPGVAARHAMFSRLISARISSFAASVRAPLLSRVPVTAGATLRLVPRAPCGKRGNGTPAARGFHRPAARATLSISCWYPVPSAPPRNSSTLALRPLPCRRLSRSLSTVPAILPKGKPAPGCPRAGARSYRFGSLGS